MRRFGRVRTGPLDRPMAGARKSGSGPVHMQLDIASLVLSCQGIPDPRYTHATLEETRLEGWASRVGRVGRDSYPSALYPPP